MNHDYIGSFWQCQMSQKLVGDLYAAHTTQFEQKNT